MSISSPNTQIPRKNSCQNRVAIIAKFIGSYGQSLIVHKVNGHLLLFISSFSQKTKASHPVDEL